MRTLYLLALASLATGDAFALETRPSPYDKIAERNLFHLQPPLTTSAAAPVAKPTLRKIKLTGIATILARPVAFLTIEGIKAQQPEFVILAEGQGVSGIEVKGIDEKVGAVRILNDGEAQTLNFETSQSSGASQIEPRLRLPAPQLPVPVPREAVLTPEEQAALIELQRIKADIEGDPIIALLPPTEATGETTHADGAP